MLRLFVGIEFPPELKLHLSMLCTSIPGAKWVDAGNLHLTLRFIGEVGEDVAADIDEARDNVVMAIDGRPALAVFLDDIGPDLARDPRGVGGIIFAGLPVQGSDTGDYLVRNLVGIDPRQGWIVLGAEVAPGDPILFCRRDPESARADLDRMLRQLAGRLQGPPKAGIYVSCIARGAALFGEPGVETGMIRDRFGDIPLIGFFANGEISRDRLYGHTGVLTLFT